MNRTYTAVMYDIARMHEGRTHSFIKRREWADIIRELAELDDERYQKALHALGELERIVDVTVPYTPRPS